MKKMTKTVEIENSCLRYMYDWDDTPRPGVSEKADKREKREKGGKKEEGKRPGIVTRQRSQS